MVLMLPQLYYLSLTAALDQINQLLVNARLPRDIPGRKN